MSFAENIKAKIKDVDVEKQLTELVDEGEKLVGDAVTKAGGIAHDKRGDVEGWLNKASGAINEKTEAKYADKVSKVRDTLLGGLDKLASKRVMNPVAEIETPAKPGTTGANGATGAAGQAESGAGDGPEGSPLS